MSHQTHYRSYRGRFYRSDNPTNSVKELNNNNNNNFSTENLFGVALSGVVIRIHARSILLI